MRVAFVNSISVQSGVPVSSVRKDIGFNDRVQADTLWLRGLGHKNKVPVLMILDAATRLLAARRQRSKTSDQFLKQLERGWVATFGVPKVFYKFW